MDVAEGGETVSEEKSSLKRKDCHENLSHPSRLRQNGQRKRRAISSGDGPPLAVPYVWRSLGDAEDDVFGLFMHDNKEESPLQILLRRQREEEAALLDLIDDEDEDTTEDEEGTNGKGEKEGEGTVGSKPISKENKALLDAIYSPSPMPMMRRCRRTKPPREAVERHLARFAPSGPLLFDEDYIGAMNERERKEAERWYQSATTPSSTSAVGQRRPRRRAWPYDDDDEEADVDADEEDDEEADDYDDEMGSSHSPRRRITSSHFADSVPVPPTISSPSPSGKRPRLRRLQTSPSPDSGEGDDGLTTTEANDGQNPRDDSALSSTTTTTSSAPATAPPVPRVNIDPAMEAGTTDDSEEDTQPME